MIKWLLGLFKAKKQLNSESGENIEIDELLAWEIYMQEFGA